MDKPAITQEPINELLQQRWSPRAFSGAGIDDATMIKILEAGRWAPSAFNAQPWRYIVARREDEAAFAKMVDCLMPGNQAWAVNAAALAIVCVQKKQNDDGSYNPMPYYNVGLSVAQMVVEAASNGLFTHQMAGINRPKMIEAYGIPAEFAPACAIAIGHMGNADDLPDQLKEREMTPRARKALSEIVFADTWGNSLQS